MTATVTTHPSSPMAALDAATRRITAGADERSYYGGFILGWAAGMTSDSDNPLRDMVLEARQHHYAATFPLLDADQRWQLLGRNVADAGRAPYLRSCGLLAGWKEGTAHYPDADVCTMCDSRVLTDEEGLSCGHGVFCDDDCRRSVCPGRCDGDLPEFDKDAYYERKYGA